MNCGLDLKGTKLRVTKAGEEFESTRPLPERTKRGQRSLRIHKWSYNSGGEALGNTPSVVHFKQHTSDYDSGNEFPEEEKRMTRKGYEGEATIMTDNEAPAPAQRGKESMGV
ncbi:hypothetical protein E2C01_011400 [Portunus trituberculatus]|uniref:Uncharacterized protein n=1 Tax=Portunus trituberculatus TaxID=210409 RepID=A0A5B7DAZ5_PORTR|nr:hypothetical protein [Portunus trituberculatus]